MLVHRIVALAFHGPCPPGMECCHLNGKKQDNRAVNLAYATRKENHAHKHRHGTAQRGEKSNGALLTDDAVRDIRRAIIQGFSMAELGRKYGVSHSTVWLVVKGKTWKHVIDETPKPGED